MSLDLRIGMHQHYTGNRYKIIGVAKFGKAGSGLKSIGTAHFSENPEESAEVLLSKDLTLLVAADPSFVRKGEFGVYMAFGTDKPLWYRPKEMFYETVETDEGDKLRFQPIED